MEVIEVLVKPGDQIKKNDPLVTIESDKSSVEIPSPSEGQIKDLKVKVGDKVSEGSLLVTLESKDSSSIQVKHEEQKVHKEIKKEKPKKNGNVVTTQSLKQIKKVFAEPASKDDIDPLETNEWIESLNSVIENDGASRASYLLNKVIDQAYKAGLVLPDTRTTPYINTIPPEAEVKSPGDQNIEKKNTCLHKVECRCYGCKSKQKKFRARWAYRNFCISCNTIRCRNEPFLEGKK